MESQTQSNIGAGIGGSGSIVGNIISSNLLNSGFTIEDRSHSFVSIVEMNHIIYCTSCMLPMWGDPYTWKCTKCLMYTHQWCRKIAAANNICNNDTQQHQHQNSLSSQTSQMGTNNKNNRQSTNIVSSTSAVPNLVNRSGSFVQRKKKKSCTSVGSPRKRSDPALTSRQMISTMANSDHNMMIGGIGTNAASTSGTLPQLTSARSSGALMNSASVGAHDSVQFRPITGQRAKHMAASDSSLMSVTSKSLKSPNPLPSGSGNIGISANTESQKSSSTNLTPTSSPRRTRHRNTNDSAIQMDGSSEDDIDEQQLNESETPASNLLNETD
ncbi:hypothetical protein BLA29_005112, partial [Euroglyphus maynei]